jgi:hypothetical protein
MRWIPAEESGCANAQPAQPERVIGTDGKSYAIYCRILAVLPRDDPLEC